MDALKKVGSKAFNAINIEYMGAKEESNVDFDDNIGEGVKKAEEEMIT